MRESERTYARCVNVIELESWLAYLGGDANLTLSTLVRNILDFKQLDADQGIRTLRDGKHGRIYTLSCNLHFVSTRLNLANEFTSPDEYRVDTNKRDLAGQRKSFDLHYQVGTHTVKILDASRLGINSSKFKPVFCALLLRDILTGVKAEKPFRFTMDDIKPLLQATSNGFYRYSSNGRYKYDMEQSLSFIEMPEPSF